MGNTAQSGATWGTASLVIGDEARLRRLAEHHLAIGASEVRLYFDDPEAAHFDAVAAIPGVMAIRCDAAFWAGARPDSHPERQVAAIRHAYAMTACDWIAHIDDDEAIYATRPLAKVLGDMPDDVGILQLRPLERILPGGAAPGEGFAGVYKRLPRNWSDRLALRLILGRFALRISEAGFLGHRQGKSVFRTGVGLAPRVHTAENYRELGLRRVKRRHVRLLHVPFRSAEEVRRKVRLRSGLDGNACPPLADYGLQYLAGLLRDRGEDHADRAFRALIGLSPRQISLLERFGLAIRLEPDDLVMRRPRRDRKAP